MERDFVYTGMPAYFWRGEKIFFGALSNLEPAVRNSNFIFISFIKITIGRYLLDVNSIFLQYNYKYIRGDGTNLGYLFTSESCSFPKHCSTGS